MKHPIARKIRTRLHRDVHESIALVNTKLEELQALQNASRRESEEIQYAINHNQLAVMNEIDKRVKNSGTIVLSENELLTKIFSGLKMYLDPRDLAITSHLALDGIWEHRITTAWLAVIQPTDTVMDIGSNNGYYGALAAQITDKKHSKVVLFEANPNLIPYIRKTLSVNWLNEQCVLENLAIADKEGELTLHVLKDYIGSSSVHSNAHVEAYMHDKMQLETAEEIKVQATSIDIYCKKQQIKTVDVMIMDIEGFEDKAYAGMKQTVKASPNVTLFIEFTRDAYEHPKAFYDEMLKDFGHVYVLDDEGYICKPRDDSYEAVIGDADDWVMPVFSKKPNLANR
jgi:FkbM family methyltransferase